MKRLAIFIAVILLISTCVAENKVQVYFFYSKYCPHCKEMNSFLLELENKYPSLEVFRYEVNSKEGREAFINISKAYNLTPRFVPTTFIDDTYFEGFSKTISQALERKIEECLKRTCANPGEVSGLITVSTTTTTTTTTTTVTTTTTLPTEENRKVIMYFFWSRTCPHCAKAKPFLKKLERKYPQLEVKSYEIHSRESIELFEKMCDSYGVPQPRGVPTFFIGDRYKVGYGSDETDGKELESFVLYCIKFGCIDPYDKINESKNITPEEAIEISKKSELVRELISSCKNANVSYELQGFKFVITWKCQEKVVIVEVDNKGNILKTYERVKNESLAIEISKKSELVRELLESCKNPEVNVSKKYGSIYRVEWYELKNNVLEGIILEIDVKEKKILSEEKVMKAFLPGLDKWIDLSAISLPLFTIIIAGLDGFNPCAFFVLCFLLSLMIYTRSRIRMFLVGLIFVITSGVIYFLFMSAWLNFFLLAGEIRAVTLLGGLIAIIAGLINVKDFFFFKKGISLTIPEEKKPELFKRMRSLVRSTELCSVLFGTAILAVAANSYELLCTFGFPLIYTRVLTLSKLPVLEYYMYLALYNLVYVLPLFAIVLFFVITFGSRKLTEEEGRILKLVSGLMMFNLGLALVFFPEIMTNFLYAIGLIILALIVAFIIILLTKILKGGGNEG